MMKQLCFVIFLSLLISACTIKKVNYALVSTKETGRFYAVNRISTPVMTVAVAVKPVNIDTVTELDKLVNKFNTPIDSTRYALVIGISQYKEQANVSYADNSAKTFSLAANKLLGIPKENIFYLGNENATSGQIKTKVALISELVEPSDTIYFFFAGHGVPGTDGNTYLLPSDMGADSIHLEPQLKLDQIYKTLNRSKAKRVYAFIDSCFSGKDDRGDLLYVGVAPVFKKQNKQFSSNKLTIMTAGGASDFANQYEEEQQRLFSYYLIKGLADQIEDIDHLYDYVRRHVKKKSLRIGLAHKQIPELQVSN